MKLKVIRMRFVIAFFSLVVWFLWGQLPPEKLSQSPDGHVLIAAIGFFLVMILFSISFQRD